MTDARTYLKEIGAKFVRKKKHEIWRLPNGRTVILSASPSDVHANSMQLRDIRRKLNT